MPYGTLETRFPSWEAGGRTLNTDSKGRRVASYTTSQR